MTVRKVGGWYTVRDKHGGAGAWNPVLGRIVRNTGITARTIRDAVNAERQGN